MKSAKQGHRLNHDSFIVLYGKRVRMEDFDPGFTDGFADKEDAQRALLEDVSNLIAAQDVLWASEQFAVLIVFQAMDAAGKDGTIKHVMSGLNPTSCIVHSFRAPTEEERSRHFLWRPARLIPGYGSIAIFNRSYYEEVLVVRVHPKFLDEQRLPPAIRKMPLEKIWRQRFDDINAFEKELADNGVLVIKFFLNVSKQEQRKRLLERINDATKHWKVDPADVGEREHWDDYMRAYEDMLSATSTKAAPWYVIPADHKWFMRAAVADVIATRINELDLHYPEPADGRGEELKTMRKKLEAEE